MNSLEVPRAAASWRPGMPVPSGHYRSPMYPDMIFRRRTDCLSVISVYSRYDTPRIPHSAISNELYAEEAKKLVSEDAARYGSAVSRRELPKYFDWRASVGLSWWHEQEQCCRAADNDNSSMSNKVAA